MHSNNKDEKENFADKLEELKRKRLQLIKPVIQNKNPGLYYLKPNQSISKTENT